jgi:AraC-like DNA-binding protein
VDPDGDAMVMRPGIPTLFPVHRQFAFDYTDYDQRLVHLNRALVEAVAAERLAVPPGGFRFDHRRPPSAAAVALWNDTVGLVSRTLSRGEVGELLWSELTRLTAVGLLELYPPTAADLPVALLEPGARRIRRVVEHIHEHAELPLTPTDLAQIADVSVRTLQESFAAVLGQTPIGYLRRVRLDRARDELRAATPGTSVGRVAQRWGFAHLGRFSAEYGRRFGERPSETLRR